MRAMFSLRQFGAKRQVQRLIQRGVGVRERSWAFTGAGGDRQAQCDAIVAWVREAMSEMRRPYGIDHVALALACRDDRGQVVCTNSFGVVRPSAFYGHDAEARLRAFFDDADVAAPQGRREVVVALLSLGEIAYQLRAA